MKALLPPRDVGFISQGEAVVGILGIADHHGPEGRVVFGETQGLLHGWPQACRSVEIAGPAGAKAH